MSRRGRSSSSVSTLQILSAAVFLLIVIIAGAFFLAPDKPIAPPGSVVSYEAPPPPKPDTRIMPLPGNWDASPTPLEEAEDPPPEPVEGAPNYRIHGVVTSARDGKPVYGASVRLRRQVTPAERTRLDTERFPPDEGEPDEDYEDASDIYLAKLKRLESPRSDRTDLDGVFSMDVELEGDYTLTAYDNHFLPHDAEQVHVLAEQKEYRVDVALSLGASIQGRVTETGGGNVAAPDIRVIIGRPRANVRLGRIFFGGMDMDRIGRGATTDLDGNYILTGLEPGEYNVTLNLGGSVYRAGKVLPFQRVKITAPEQEVSGVDFSVDVAGIVWGYVRNQDDSPAKADMVLVTDESVVSQVLSAALKRAPPIFGRSNEEQEGYYELKGVPLNKEWRVYATSKNMPPQMSEPFILTPKQRSVRVDINLFLGTDIFGHVIDPAGTPVARADIVCFTGVSKLFTRINTPPAIRDTNSDSEGYFHIKQLPAGSFQIHVNKEGYKFSARGEAVYADGYNNIENFNIVLHPIDEGTEQVFGHVVDSAGRAVAGARVNLGGLGTVSLSAIERKTETGADGGFLIDAVEIGTYVLNVRAEGYSPHTVHRVRFNEENLIEVQAISILAGTVLVRETGQPLDGGRISVMPINDTGQAAFGVMLTGGAQSASSSIAEDGRFELEVRAGSYRVEARGQGYAPGRAEVTIDVGERVDGLRIYVSERGGSIEGRVVADGRASTQGTMLILIEGQSIAETAMLLASVPDASSGQITRADADGAFRFETLGEGVYNVIAQHPRYARAESGMLELAANQNLRGVEVRLGEGGGIEGVVYKDKRPVPGASVMAMANGLPEMASADDTGYYEFEGLAAGVYQLMVVPEGIGDLANIAGIQSVPVEVVQGRVTWQDLGDTLGGVTLLGRVEPKPETAVLGFAAGYVQLRSPGTPPMMPIGASAEFTAFAQTLGQRGAIIGRDGLFQIPNVPPGEYALDVYFPEGFTLRFVSTQALEVPEGADEVPVVVTVRQE